MVCHHTHYYLTGEALFSIPNSASLQSTNALPGYSTSSFIIDTVLECKVDPAFAAAVQKHGGTLGMAPTSANIATVLVTSDLQQPDLGDARPDVTNLHVTTVDHVLVSIANIRAAACSSCFSQSYTTQVVCAMTLRSTACVTDRLLSTVLKTGIMLWLLPAAGGNATWHHRQYDTGGVSRQAECSMAASSSWTNSASQEESLCRYSHWVMP